MRNVKSTSGSSKTRQAAGAGRVVLAAIVHYGSSGELADEIPTTAINEKPAMTEVGRCSTLNMNPTDKSTLKRFGKLFFSRRKQQQQQQTSATLIDDIAGGGNLQAHHQNGTADRDTGAHQEPPKQQQANKKRSNTSDRNHHREQVIEFKFDLIVDRKSELKVEALSWPASLTKPVGIHDWKLAEMLNELVGSSVLESNDVCLMSVGRQQVAASTPVEYPSSDFTYICQLAAHTLQYSFHLLEQSRLAQQAAPDDGLAMDHWTPFEFSVELSASLVVLGEAPTSPNNSSQPRLQIVDLVSGLRHDFGQLKGKRRPEIDCDESHHSTAVALGRPPVVSGDRREGDESNEQLESRSIDCWTCEEALEMLARIRDELQSEPTRHLLAKTDKRTLLIGLKLKQRINGGLFSNRISVIDFEPKFVELYSILESAFNGQALAYLKRQKQVPVSGSPLWRPTERRPWPIDSKLTPNSNRAQVIGTSQLKDADTSRDLSEQQLDASEEEESREALARAEWLLYKQLSSALIRTLLVVHVNKLDRQHLHSTSITNANNNKPSASTSDEQELEKLELRLMADNLLTLEFASSIQRASAMRLRRRKRHLRSHLASSNTSITSNLSACKVQSHPTTASPHIAFPSDTLGSGQPIRDRHHRKVSLMDEGLMLVRHRPRHRCLSTTHSSRQSLARSRVTEGRVRNSHKSSGPDFTESSSMSTSSGGNVAHIDDCLFHNASTAQSRVNEWKIQHPGSSRYNTDDSDSLASAYLESRSSSTSRHNRNNKRSQKLRQSPMKWEQYRKVPSQTDCTAIELTNLNHLRSTSQLHCKSNHYSSQSSKAPTIKSQSRASSVIKIDCPSMIPAHTRVVENLDNLETRQKHVNGSCMTPEASQTPNGFDLLITDNVSVSDLCNAVAEPPKQLKLEQFLNQIGNIINSPQRHALPVPKETTATTGKECDMRNSNMRGNTVDTSLNSSVHRQNNLKVMEPSVKHERDRVGHNVEEDDEDCKSHSSILDHLSTMALESMAKLNNRAASNQLVEGRSNVQPPSGHLQRLLNSSQPQKMMAQVSNGSSHVALKDSSGIANHLKALSVNCTPSQCNDLPNSFDENSPSPASFVHSSTSSSSGFSSAIAGSLDNAKCHHNSSNIPPPEYLHTVSMAQPVGASYRKQDQQEQDKMYAKVIKAPSVM